MINGKKIRGRMVELGFTLKDLAGPDCLNCSESTVSLKLNGKRPINVKEADALGKKLKLSNMEYYDYFFGSVIA